MRILCVCVYIYTPFFLTKGRVIVDASFLHAAIIVRWNLTWF